MPRRSTLPSPQDERSCLTPHKRMGLIVRRLRILRGLSQQQLAELLDTSQKQISRIELGKSPIDAVALFRFAEILGVSVDRFKV